MLRAANCDILASVEGSGPYDFEHTLQVLRHEGTGQHYFRRRYFGGGGPQYGTQQDVAYPLTDSEAGRAVEILNDATLAREEQERELLCIVGEPDGGEARTPVYVHSKY